MQINGLTKDRLTDGYGYRYVRTCAKEGEDHVFFSSFFKTRDLVRILLLWSNNTVRSIRWTFYDDDDDNDRETRALPVAGFGIGK